MLTQLILALGLYPVIDYFKRKKAHKAEDKKFNKLPKETQEKLIAEYARLQKRGSNKSEESQLKVEDEYVRLPSGELNREWVQRPGKIQEHVDPSEMYSRERRQINKDSASTGSSLLHKHYENGNSATLDQNVFHKLSQTAQYKGEDRAGTKENGILTSVKSGINYTKTGINHGISHAGHQLGLWDEGTSTSPNQEHVLSSPNPTPSHNNKIASPTHHNKINHLKEAAKSTAGMSTMGAIFFIVLALLFAWFLKRRISRKKASRFIHIEEGDAWKERVNGQSGIFAHEFDEYSDRVLPGVKDDEESQLKKV